MDFNISGSASVISNIVGKSLQELYVKFEQNLVIRY